MYKIFDTYRVSSVPLHTFITNSSFLLSRAFILADAEVAADGERLGLLFYFVLLLDVGFELDLGRTFGLTLDPLRTRRTCARIFALRTVLFQFAVGAAVAVQAALFQLAMRAGDARRAVVFHLPVRARVALLAAAFLLPVRIRLAVRAVAFPLSMGASISSHYSWHEHTSRHARVTMCGRAREARVS